MASCEMTFPLPATQLTEDHRYTVNGETGDVIGQPKPLADVM